MARPPVAVRPAWLSQPPAGAICWRIATDQPCIFNGSRFDYLTPEAAAIIRAVRDGRRRQVALELAELCTIETGWEMGR